MITFDEQSRRFSLIEDTLNFTQPHPNKRKNKKNKNKNKNWDTKNKTPKSPTIPTTTKPKDDKTPTSTVPTNPMAPETPKKSSNLSRDYLISGVGGAAVGSVGGLGLSSMIAKRVAKKRGIKPGTPEYEALKLKYSRRGALIGAGTGAGAGLLGTYLYKKYKK